MHCTQKVHEMFEIYSILKIECNSLKKGLRCHELSHQLQNLIVISMHFWMAPNINELLCVSSLVTFSHNICCALLLVAATAPFDFHILFFYIIIWICFFIFANAATFSLANTFMLRTAHARQLICFHFQLLSIFIVPTRQLLNGLCSAICPRCAREPLENENICRKLYTRECCEG